MNCKWHRAIIPRHSISLCTKLLATIPIHLLNDPPVHSTLAFGQLTHPLRWALSKFAVLLSVPYP